ncbi:hypothetical protein D3C71_2153050 [compost metagenome]
MDERFHQIMLGHVLAMYEVLDQSLALNEALHLVEVILQTIGWLFFVDNRHARLLPPVAE